MTGKLSTKVVDEDGQRLAEMLGAALPKITCQACKSSSFSLLKSTNRDLLTAVHYYDGSNPLPQQFTQTLAIACNNCGYVMHFVMPAVKKLAQDKGWQDPQDG
jgi:predicted nucleic-acid-binding Zn-ribbon protein